MLGISEANRDQVLSIRKVQSIIDNSKGASKTEVIFEKYRQTIPFQIGLANGEDILQLFSLVRLECDFTLEEIVASLNAIEEIFESQQQELEFYESRYKGGTSEDRIEELKINIEVQGERAFTIKVFLVDSICRVVQSEYSDIPIVEKRSLIKHIYVSLSSSIQTLDSELVEV